MTVLGNHTVKETRELITVVQYRFDQVENAYKGISKEWRDAHPQDARLLDLEWANEKKHWQEVRDSVAKSLTWKNSTNVAPADMIASEEEWKAILGFVEYGASSGVERRPDDLRSIQERIEKIRGQQVDLQGVPKMSTDDPDMNAVKTLDASIAAAKGGAMKAAKDVSDVGNKAAKNNATYLVVGGAVGALVLVGLAKFYFPRL